MTKFSFDELLQQLDDKSLSVSLSSSTITITPLTPPHLLPLPKIPSGPAKHQKVKDAKKIIKMSATGASAVDDVSSLAQNGT